MLSSLNKADFRKQALLKRDSLSVAFRSSASRRICEALNEQVKGYKNIFAYYPFRSEVDIKPFLSNVFENGSALFLPKVISNNEMVFRRFHGFNNMVKGAYGIMEACLLENEEDIAFVSGSSIMLIPGAAFGKDMNRLGYGAGFYDRFLERQEDNIKKVGVAFEAQLYNTVPHEEFDVKLDEIVTEDRIIV